MPGKRLGRVRGASGECLKSVRGASAGCLRARPGPLSVLLPTGTLLMMTTMMMLLMMVTVITSSPTAAECSDSCGARAHALPDWRLKPAP